MEMVDVKIPEIDFTKLTDQELRDFIRDVHLKEHTLVRFAHGAYMEDVRRAEKSRPATQEARAARRSYKLPKLTAARCQVCNGNLKPNELDGICSSCLPT